MESGTNSWPMVEGKRKASAGARRPPRGLSWLPDPNHDPDPWSWVCVYSVYMAMIRRDKTEQALYVYYTLRRNRLSCTTALNWTPPFPRNRILRKPQRVGSAVLFGREERRYQRALLVRASPATHSRGLKWVKSQTYFIEFCILLVCP